MKSITNRVKGLKLSQTSKSKKCTKCNLEFSSKYKFCTECGQALKKINNCPSCSSRLNKSSKFCSNCGESINPSRNGAETKPVYVPYSASKDEFNEEETSEEGSDKAKGILIGLGMLVGLIFLIIIFANSGGNSQQNYPTCMKWSLGYQIGDGWGWGRPDNKVGYCVLPNSNEVIYSEIGSVK